MAGLYLKPVGIVFGAEAQSLAAEGAALPLAGGPLAFTGARVSEGDPGDLASSHVSAHDLLASKEGDLRDLVERVTAPRGTFAGLALDRPLIMGVVNVTPDSFSDGGDAATADAAIARARKLAADGADILDIGGESTRPRARPVSADEELGRIMPVIEALKDGATPISVDTRNAAVMRAAVQAGAAVINDVTALTHDPESLETAAKSRAAVVLMHAKGDPSTMQDDPAYLDVVAEVYDVLAARIAAAEEAGMARRLLAVDPGFGFGKTFAHNMELFENLAVFHGLGVPLLIGASRKSFVGRITGRKEPKERVSGSIGMALAALAQGVQMVRVHDVAETRDAVRGWLNARGQAGDRA